MAWFWAGPRRFAAVLCVCGSGACWALLFIFFPAPSMNSQFTWLINLCRPEYIFEISFFFFLYLLQRGPIATSVITRNKLYKQASKKRRIEPNKPLSSSSSPLPSFFNMISPRQ
ncbi:hypothetical protein F5X99DRAFT_287215 [Biscogniauxia marginata]|nr:hypothetical protein F5X99DRAFT_287215 [Biscogniauxia marginata]